MIVAKAVVIALRTTFIVCINNLRLMVSGSTLFHKDICNSYSDKISERNKIPSINKICTAKRAQNEYSVTIMLADDCKRHIFTLNRASTIFNNILWRYV